MTGRIKIGWIVLAALVVIGMLVGGAAYGLHLLRGDSVDGLEAGDCLASAPTEKPPYKKAKCAEAAAVYTVLAFAGEDDDQACREVAGASSFFITGGRAVCLGDKGVDPARAINVAKKGDCVELPNPRDAYRIDCSNPKAAYQILMRLTDVPKKSAGGPCAGVPGAIQAYAWNWKTTDPIGGLAKDENDDVVLCLGTGPTVAASYSAAQADRSNCRYISDQDMAAAVSKATGKQYTVRYHGDSKLLGCDYQFTKEGEYVNVEMARGLEWRPGTGSDVLTVDGLRAYYDPGEGNRAIGVEIAGGVFSVVVRLSDTRDSTSKKVGIAVFQAARPKVG